MKNKRGRETYKKHIRKGKQTQQIRKKRIMRENRLTRKKAKEQ